MVLCFSVFLDFFRGLDSRATRFCIWLDDLQTGFKQDTRFGRTESSISPYSWITFHQEFLCSAVLLPQKLATWPWQDEHMHIYYSGVAPLPSENWIPSVLCWFWFHVSALVQMISCSSSTLLTLLVPLQRPLASTPGASAFSVEIRWRSVKICEDLWLEAFRMNLHYHLQVMSQRRRDYRIHNMCVRKHIIHNICNVHGCIVVYL